MRLTVVDLPESTCLDGYMSVPMRAIPWRPRRREMERDKPNDNDVKVELLLLAIHCVSSVVDEAIKVFRDRAGVGDNDLPHFDGVFVLKNETGDLRLMESL